MDVIIIGSADVVSGCPYNQSDHRVTPSLGSCPSHLIIGQSFNSMQSGDKMTFAIIFIIWCDEMRMCHCHWRFRPISISICISKPHTTKRRFISPLRTVPSVVVRCHSKWRIASTGIIIKNRSHAPSSVSCRDSSAAIMR